MSSRTPARSAWDYGVPEAAAEQVARTLHECLGPNLNGVVLPNIAAAVVFDILTSGVMLPAIPDVPPPARAALT